MYALRQDGEGEEMIFKKLFVKIFRIRKEKFTIPIKTLIVVIVLLSCQVIVSHLQFSRYHYDVGSDDNYACTQMSRDVESFFESIGIHTLIVSNSKYDYSSTFNGTRDLKYKTVSGVLPSYDEGHMALVLDFFGFYIPYESTLLLPFFNIGTFHGFEDAAISEGFYVDGVFMGDDYNNFEWEEYH